MLIHRIANLMKYGRGSDADDVPEWSPRTISPFWRTT